MRFLPTFFLLDKAVLEYPRKYRCMAFTLVELLVSAAILSILAVLIHSIIASTSSAISSEQRRLEVQAKAMAALDLIERDVTNGIFRSDLPAFLNDSNETALAFFTKRAGLVQAGESVVDYRLLSFVFYPLGKQENFSLSRGLIHLKWDAKESFPTTSATSLPYATNAWNSVYLQANTVKEEVLDGVGRLEIRFLGKDGQFRKSYETSGADASQAIVVTLITLDDKSRDFLNKNTAFKSAVETALFNNTAPLPVPDESENSLATLWEDAFANAATWQGIPANVSSGIRVFERVIPLR